MITSLENAVASRVRRHGRPVRPEKSDGNKKLRGTPTTTPPGWTQGTKTGWNGSDVPPGRHFGDPQFRQRFPQRVAQSNEALAAKLATPKTIANASYFMGAMAKLPR